jgi:hypothetical protein
MKTNMKTALQLGDSACSAGLGFGCDGSIKNSTTNIECFHSNEELESTVFSLGSPDIQVAFGWSDSPGS